MRTWQTMKGAWLFLACLAVSLVGAVRPVRYILAEEATCESLAGWCAARLSQPNADSLIALRFCVGQTRGAKIGQR